MLKATKGQSALVEVFVRFGGIQAEAANKVVHSPELAVGIPVAVIATKGGDKVQYHSGIVYPLPDVIRHGAGVDHNLHGIFEHILVDLLQDVFSAAVGSDLKGMVNMSVTEVYAGYRLSADPEGICRFLYVHVVLLKDEFFILRQWYLSGSECSSPGLLRLDRSQTFHRSRQRNTRPPRGYTEIRSAAPAESVPAP